MAAVLVTGAAGFIGFHVCRALLERGEEVIGIDSLTPYYDVSLKESRLEGLRGYDLFRFLRADIADAEAMRSLFSGAGADRVVHLAAQVGVRHSLVDPHSYAASNLTGFVNVLEGCRSMGIRVLVYASSSSVYGGAAAVPFSEEQRVDRPLNLYAATKCANEMMAHSYAYLFSIACTGLRFFTVYGPWGRPDMAVYSFASAIDGGREVLLHGRGEMRRDFTYIDDVVAGVLAALDSDPPGTSRGPLNAAAAGRQLAAISTGAAGTPDVPHRVYNLGGQEQYTLRRLVELLARSLGRSARLRLVDAEPGEMRETLADCEAARRDLGYAPRVSLEEGIGRFVSWYRDYHS